MARPTGTRNPGFERKRRELAERVALRAVEPDGREVSMRELARAADVSVPTLRHYFGDREGALAAAFDAMNHLGESHVRRMAEDHIDDLERSVRFAVTYLIQGFRDFGVGRMLGGAMAHAMANEQLGPAFLDALLEPTLQAVERRLAVHIERGEMHPVDPRHAAIGLVSPMLVAALHQGELGGTQCRPLDLEALGATQVEAFLRAYAA